MSFKGCRGHGRGQKDRSQGLPERQDVGQDLCGRLRPTQLSCYRRRHDAKTRSRSSAKQQKSQFFDLNLSLSFCKHKHLMEINARINSILIV